MEASPQSEVASTRNATQRNASSSFVSSAVFKFPAKQARITSQEIRPSLSASELANFSHGKRAPLSATNKWTS